MRIIFESETEKTRIGAMVENAIEQADLDIRDKILLLNIKNVLFFFGMEIEKGDIQPLRDITPRAEALPAPNRKRQAKP